MDFFKKAGNWFRGAFGESEEEKRRKKKEAQEAKRRQAQIQKPKPLVNPVVSPLFGDKKKPDQPDPTKPKLFQAQPAVTPPLTRPPELNKDQKQAQLQQLRAQYNAGRVNREQLEQQARKILGTQEKKLNAPKEVYREVKPIVQAAIRAPEQGIRSLGQFFEGTARGAVTGDIAESNRIAEKNWGRSKKLDPVRKALYGQDNVESYFKEFGDIGDELTKAGHPVAGAAVAIGAPAATIGLDAAGLMSGTLIKQGVKKFGQQAVEKQLVKTLAEKGIDISEQEAKNLVKGSGKLVDDVAETAVKDAEKVAEDLPDTATEKTLRQIAEDKDRPAYQRAKAQEELDKMKLADKEAADRLATIEKHKAKLALGDDPANLPAYQFQAQRTKIIQDEMDNLTNYLGGNPGLTKAQREVAQKAAEKRADDLVKALDESRLKTLGVVTEQGDEIAANAAKQAEVQAEVAAEQAAKTAPAPGQVVQDAPTPAKSPEVAANDAYSPEPNKFSGITAGNSEKLQDDIMKALGYDIAPKERKNLLSQLFGIVPRTTQRITDPISDIANKTLMAGSQSKNPIVSKLSQLPRPIAARFGMTDKARASLDSLEGLRNTAKEVGLKVSRKRNETIKQLIDDGASPDELTKIFHQVFSEPEVLARKYGDNVPKLSPNDLPPQLKQIVDEQIELNKIRNVINFKTGIIDEATYFKGIDGMHTPRVYGFDFNAKGGGFANKFDTTAGISRNELDDIPDEIFDTLVDPLTAQDVRFQQALVNKSRLDAIQNIKTQFGAFDNPPNNGYTRLLGKEFGELDGKWVDNQVAAALKSSNVFKTGAGQKADELLDMWRNSPLGTLDRAVKQKSTILSPGVEVGNIGSNITAFSGGAGLDPITATVRGAGGAKDLIAESRGAFNADIYTLRKAGIIDGNTGRAITGVPEKDVIKVESLLTDAEAMATNNPMQATKAFHKAMKFFQDIYGGTDDAFKIGAFRELKARGYSDELALRRVREQYQNYANVGHAIQMAADSPILGKPFARFVPELVRILKNSIRNNPVGMAAGLGTLAYGADKLSELSGESDKERNQRENTIGQTNLPGTAGINKLVTDRDKNISLNIAVPDKIGDVDLPGKGSAVNIARATGLNFPMDTSGDPNRALGEQLSPVAIPIREDKGGNTVFAPEEVVSSMAFNPLARLFANRDFMGRRITDPENTVRYEGNGVTRYKYENPDGTPMDKEEIANLNRLRYLFMAYSPLSSEIDATQAGIRGKDDFYGKQRTPGQSILRALGIKVEDNSPKAREKRAEQQEFFGEKLPEVQKFLNENPDLTETYWKLKNTARDRNTEVSQNDLVSPERFKIIASDKSGRLFEFLRKQAIAKAKEEKTEIDPLYTLPNDQANQVIALKAMYTGDDVKFQQLLYEQPWFEGYKEAERKYNQNKPEREEFEGAALPNDRPERWYALSEELYAPEGVASRYPLVKQYNDKIKTFENYDSDERKAFTKNWYATYGDSYNLQKDQYERARLGIVNQMREIEGAPPISIDVWKGKFEVDDDSSSGYSYGRGGGGGGGGGSDINTLGDLTNFSNSVNRLDPIEIAAMPQIKEMFARLKAAPGGGKARAKLGASASGR